MCKKTLPIQIIQHINDTTSFVQSSSDVNSKMTSVTGSRAPPMRRANSFGRDSLRLEFRIKDGTDPNPIIWETLKGRFIADQVKNKSFLSLIIHYLVSWFCSSHKPNCNSLMHIKLYIDKKKLQCILSKNVNIQFFFSKVLSKQLISIFLQFLLTQF